MFACVLVYRDVYITFASNLACVLIFQGVQDDISTLLGNVKQLNEIAKVLQENCDSEFKDHLEKQTEELNQNWKKVTDLARNQNNKLTVSSLNM